jgi:hypothetical protein
MECKAEQLCHYDGIAMMLTIADMVKQQCHHALNNAMSCIMHATMPHIFSIIRD